MIVLDREYISSQIAASAVIYERGERIFNFGNYYLKEADPEYKNFSYYFDGNYGDYDVVIAFDNNQVSHSCNCPYPNPGCKHTVAALLDVIELLQKKNKAKAPEPIEPDDILSPSEIRQQALENRKKSAKQEVFNITFGEMFKGEHVVVNQRGRQYIVTLHEPLNAAGTCTCPDFNSNRLGTCKHLLHVADKVKQVRGFAARGKKEKFPYVHVYWDSAIQKPRFFYNRPLPEYLHDDFAAYFDEAGFYKHTDLTQLFRFLQDIQGKKGVKVETAVMEKVDKALFLKEGQQLRESFEPDFSLIRATLYPYQTEGVKFALFKKSAIIADEMGLGKTLQAIAVAVLKKDLFHMEKVLVVTPASLKEQWRREIERFTDEDAIVVAGPKRERRAAYLHNNAYFKITNYEAVLRDIDEIHLFQPDLIILDEAQRIKNFETKTFQTIQSVPHKQSLVLTGTPLENKLEDFYAISQFADADLFTPLWSFAANHFILRKSKKNKIFGYKNLQALHEKLPALVIRRRKEEVLSELPREVTNNYYIELSGEQFKLHQGYLSSLMPYINKKFLTPMDIRRIQELLTCMRMVCNSTFLVDRNTNISPKLRELEVVLNDVAIENKRKIVIFSEWTTMTFLIGKVLSELSIPFVELSGKIPTAKRQRLIDEFTNNQNCQVFLSTDAGGVGLNLQAADCVINFELPWNPARLNQRIGRVSRIGQKSSCINVINFIARNSIEEKILAGIHLKLEVFDAVFEGTSDEVEFSREKKLEFINKIREMIGQEQEPLPKHVLDKEELPDETPHYLNPKVLYDQEEDVVVDQDISMEEEMPEPSLIEQSDRGAADKQQIDFEKMESVMENGMSFLSGLMQMATGKPLVSETGEKMITINKETVEVTLKFKLPL